MDYANAKNFKTAQQTPIKRGWLATKDLQLQVNIGTFMLEPWERNLVSMWRHLVSMQRIFVIM